VNRGNFVKSDGVLKQASGRNHAQTNSKMTSATLEWFDLRALQQYACISERTLREWIHRPVDALPAVRVGAKILVRRSVFDSWLEGHQLKPADVGGIVDEMVAAITGKH
jgi:hypothetical protein